MYKVKLKSWSNIIKVWLKTNFINKLRREREVTDTPPPPLIYAKTLEPMPNNAKGGCQKFFFFFYNYVYHLIMHSDYRGDPEVFSTAKRLEQKLFFRTFYKFKFKVDFFGLP